MEWTTVMAFRRPDGRKPTQMREIEFVLHVAPSAKGSVLVRFGNTRVLCGVSVEEGVPRWMRQQNVEGGWLTAEYSLLPYSTPQRTAREVNAGRVGGRTQEIQRLIGRALRAVMDLKLLGERTIWVDCDVLQADGGTRTAAITGSYVALRLAVHALLNEGALEKNPIREPVAAVSVGIVQGRPVLDLCYEEDVAAEVDMNVVMTRSGRFVEIQGTAEKAPFSRSEVERLLGLAQRGIRQILRAQASALHRAGIRRA